MEDVIAIAEYAIEVDIGDYITRGNPHQAGHVSASGTRLPCNSPIRNPKPTPTCRTNVLHGLAFSRW